MQALANVYSEEGQRDQSKYAAAARLYDLALKIQEANLGPDHPQLFPLLAGYVTVLHSVHNETQAAQVQARIDAIRKILEAPNRRN